jgi:hypothetical protein
MLDVFEASIDSETGKKIDNRKTPIYEQWGYDSRKYNRIKFRLEHELEEFNFGIDFTQLKNSKE